MRNAQFIHDDFLLDTEEARQLYHGHAASQPIIDFHTHLPPAEVAEDKRWQNLTQIWLYGDHYKWRAMRSNGIAEDLVTGPAGDRARFDAWAATMPYLLRNPLYHWTHLELARYFETPELLSPKSADQIWERGLEMLARPALSARGLIAQSRVEVICTTDDPTDSLEHHAAIARDSCIDVKVLPTWRPDKALHIEDPVAFNQWADSLAKLAGIELTGYVEFIEALEARHDFFAAQGCLLADHGIETFYAAEYAEGELTVIFEKVRGGKAPSPDEIEKWRSAILYDLCVMNAAKGWTQQFHFGPMRNNNSRLFAKLGPDAGFDSMGDLNHSVPMSRFLDRLDEGDNLAKTILYGINPKDNAVVASMLGNFQDGSIPGKIQMGSAWWFLDQLDGMERQIEDLSSMGLLSRFVGMLTDSRSYLSFTRHEYFRRILCNLLGHDIARGRLPRDFAHVGGMVEDVCYRNAVTYLGFPLDGKV
ncbi:glucuronate isomerase [soil metagenome]